MSNKDSIKMLKLLRAAKKALDFLKNESNRDLFLSNKFVGFIGLSSEIEEAIHFAESYEE